MFIIPFSGNQLWSFRPSTDHWITLKRTINIVLFEYIYICILLFLLILLHYGMSSTKIHMGLYVLL